MAIENNLPPGLFDWNELSIDDCIQYLKSKYMFSSSGDAKCIYEVIQGYQKLKEESMDQKTKEVFDAILSERKYQTIMTANSERPDMIEDLHIGDTLSAIQHNLDKAREAWYKGSAPHQDAMEYIRKITALGVQAGEKYGMPFRELPTKIIDYCPHSFVPAPVCVENCICDKKNFKNCSFYDPKNGCMIKDCKCSNEDGNL